jgi:hypothetical protein
MKLLDRLEATSNPTLLHFYRGCRNVDPGERYEVRLMRVQGTYSLGKYLQNLSGASKSQPLSAVSVTKCGDLVCLFDDIATLCVDKEKLSDKERRKREIEEEGVGKSSPFIDLSQRSNSNSDSFSGSKGDQNSTHIEDLEGSRKRTIDSISTSASAGQQSVESKGGNLAHVMPLSTALAEHLAPALVSLWTPLKNFMLCLQSKIHLSNDVMSNRRYALLTLFLFLFSFSFLLLLCGIRMMNSCMNFLNFNCL